MSSEQKLKEGDSVIYSAENTNNTQLLFFTDKAQVYKTRASDFKETKASAFGDYAPAKLNMDEDEKAIFMVATKDYSGTMILPLKTVKLQKFLFLLMQPKLTVKAYRCVQ